MFPFGTAPSQNNSVGNEDIYFIFFQIIISVGNVRNVSVDDNSIPSALSRDGANETHTADTHTHRCRIVCFEQRGELRG
jgi:hypothetical protein